MGPARRHLLVLGLLGVAITGCRGDEETAKQVQEESIADELRAYGDTLISERQIRATESRVERSFLRYWSALQYQAWIDAAQTYDPALLKDAGPATVLEALESQTTYFRGAKPRKITIKRARGGRRTIRYFVKNPGGELEPRSMVWERVNGRWVIFYDPFLNEILRSSVTNRTQGEVSPGEDISAKARAAGARAAQRQSRSVGGRLSKRPAAETRPGDSTGPQTGVPAAGE